MSFSKEQVVEAIVSKNNKLSNIKIIGSDTKEFELGASILIEADFSTLNSREVFDFYLKKTNRKGDLIVDRREYTIPQENYIFWRE